MLSCDRITLRKGERLLCAGLGITVGEGGCLILRGANGSGKTTLLRVMAGLEKPDSGEVLWQGDPIAAWGESYAQHLVYLGHKNALKPEMSVAENLLVWAGMTGSELMVEAALHYWKLGDYADTRVGDLSAGWQRRVALARLLCRPAELWLLDEPGVNLDAEGLEILHTLITGRLKQRGIVILSTHAELPVTPVMELRLVDFMVVEEAMP